jgi:2',3'-cyclic-nucleotide 2'-phosphodiesterase (5'-nucleotidase family)
MENNRRGFLKKVGAIGAGTALATVNPILSFADENVENTLNQEGDSEFTISILQTTDVHCQVHPHDELFWENEQSVFRKTGGYAHLATYLKKEKKNNPDTFIIDTGDMFQGSELSVKTSGKAMIPVLNELGYDLYLPGNW